LKSDFYFNRFSISNCNRLCTLALLW